MSFTWNYTLTDFLFENFNIDKVSTCILVTVAVFFTALIVESAKYFELYLNKIFEKKINFMKNANDDVAALHEQSPLVVNLRIPSSLQVIKRQRVLLLFVKTILRMFTLVLAYIVMLIAMNYYSGHFIAIIFGFGLGHYLLNSTATSLEFISQSNSNVINSNGDTKRLNLRNSSQMRNVNYDEI